MSQRDADIANTILAQLGGNRFRVMTGSRDFAAVERGLQFKVGKNSFGVNFCRIRRNDADTYDVEYGFLRSGRVTVKASSEGVYFDQLQADFTRNTGMYTRL